MTNSANSNILRPYVVRRQIEISKGMYDFSQIHEEPGMHVNVFSKVLILLCYNRELFSVCSTGYNLSVIPADSYYNLISVRRGHVTFSRNVPVITQGSLGKELAVS